LQVLAILPHSGPASGGTPIVVSGTGFLSGNALLIGGAGAVGMNVVSPTEIDAVLPPLPAGTLNDVVVTSAASPVPARSIRPADASLTKGWFADFLDVPQADGFHDFIERIFRSGITAGVGGGNYGRNDPVTRAQLAVFLLTAKFGAGYAPPAATGTVFGDVHIGDFAADWIEDLAIRGITAGCGGGNYCPNAPVTRAEIAALLLLAEHGSGYLPPPCTGIFTDVACSPSPAFAVDWIEALYNEGITGGCDVGLYCPEGVVTRGQVAVFLTSTFGLSLYPQ